MCGWPVRCMSIVLALAFCASAFAGPSNDVALPATQRPAQKSIKKMCYVMTTTSRTPLPCERLAAIPTTASPMTIFGTTTRK